MGKLVIHCQKPDHQRHAWRGDVCCSSCERVFQTRDEDGAHFAPVVCPCGLRLMPGGGAERGKLAFSARAICHGCFLDRTASTPPPNGKD